MTLREIVEAMEADNASESEIGFGGGAQPQQPLPMGPKFHAIAQLLIANPLLVEPTLIFVQQKLGEIAAAQMRVLYTEEQLEELRKRMEET